MHEVDHRVQRVGVELGGVGAQQPELVAAELDHHHLEAQAQAQARDVVLTRVRRRGDLALDAPRAEPAGDHHAVEVPQPSRSQQPLDLLGVDPLNVHLHPVVGGRMAQRLAHRQVGVGQRHVLADDAHAHLGLRRLDAGQHRFPLGQVGRHVFEAQDAAQEAVEALGTQHHRDLVQHRRIGGVHHAGQLHVAEAGDLVAQPVLDRAFAAQHDGVGLDAAAAQLGHRVLGGLGLLLAGRADERHQGDMHVADVLAAHFEAHLADGFEERQDLDVAHRAAHLGDHDVHVGGGELADALLDLVGDVGDDLHRAPEVLAAPLVGQHLLVDGAGGGVGVAGERHVDEPLVVAEIEVGLAAVVGDEHLAVLVRVERAGVDVDVGVQLLHGDPQAAGRQQPPERRRSQPLAERARNPASDKNVLGHAPPSPTDPHRAWRPLGLASSYRHQPRRWLTLPPGRMVGNETERHHRCAGGC